jgi:hypothetical protein
VGLNTDVSVITMPGSTGNVKYTLPVNFDLKAVVLLTNGQDSDGTVAHGHFCVGCGTYRGAAVQRWYHGVYVHDGNAAMQTVRLKGSTAILKLNTNTNVAVLIDLEVDLVSFTTEAGSSSHNAFTLNWVNLFTTASIKVICIALGGSDISDAYAHVFTGSGTAGANQDVTVVAGFGQPDLMMFSGCFNAVGDSAADAVTSLSWAKSATERRVSQTTFDDGNASTWGAAFQGNRALHNINVSAVEEGVAELAAKVNWPTDGFRLTWAVATSGAPSWGALSLKGTFQAKIGSNTIPTSGSPPVVQDNDAGFAPLLGFLWGHNLPTTAGVDQTHADLGQFFTGVFDGTDEACVSITYDDGNAVSAADRSMTQTKALQMMTSVTPTVDAEADGSFSGNNMRLSFSDVGSLAREYNWLALGAAAGGVPTTPIAVSAGLTLTPDVTRIATRPRAISVGLTMTALLTKVVLGYRALSVSLTMAAAMTKVASRPRAFAAGLTLTPAMTFAKVKLQSIVAGLTLTGAVSIVKIRVKALTASLTLMSVLSFVTTKPRSFNVGLIMTPALVNVATHFKTISAGLTVAPAIVRVKSAPRTLSAALTLTPAMSKMKSAPRAIAASLTLTPIVLFGKLLLRAIPATLNLTGGISLMKVKGLTIPLTVTLTATHTRSKIWVRAIPVTLTLTAAHTRLVSLSKTFAAALSLVPAVGRIKTAPRQIDTSLALTAALARMTTHYRAVNTPLILTPDVSLSKVRRVTASASLLLNSVLNFVKLGPFTPMSFNVNLILSPAVSMRVNRVVNYITSSIVFHPILLAAAFVRPWLSSARSPTPIVESTVIGQPTVIGADDSEIPRVTGVK